MSKIYSENNIRWNYVLDGYNGYIGGTFRASNLSGGFHGLLKQWWEYFTLNIDNPKVLLVCENLKVKSELNNIYKNWNISVIDLFPNLQNNEDVIISDICKEALQNKYDLIINQANLEHMYNPFGVMSNLCNGLNKGGYLITHTHAQTMKYHQYPRDYIRFMIDWWYDLPQHISDIKLVELYEDDNLKHVLTCYEKIN